MGGSTSTDPAAGQAWPSWPCLDGALPNTKARFRCPATARDAPKFDVPFGASQHRAIRVGKVLRLQLSDTNLTHIDMTAAHGGARVRCTKRPG